LYGGYRWYKWYKKPPTLGERKAYEKHKRREEAVRYAKETRKITNTMTEKTVEAMMAGTECTTLLEWCPKKAKANGFMVDQTNYMIRDMLDKVERATPKVVNEMNKRAVALAVANELTAQAQVAEVVKELVPGWNLPPDIMEKREEAINGLAPTPRMAVKAHAKAIRDEVVVRSMWAAMSKTEEEEMWMGRVAVAVVAMDARTVEESLITKVWAMMKELGCYSSSSSSSSYHGSIFGPVMWEEQQEQLQGD
jgi:hypothetical protein